MHVTFGNFQNYYKSKSEHISFHNTMKYSFWIHVKETYEDMEPTLTALYSTVSMLPWQKETYSTWEVI
jgi:hypothetical protein